MAEKKINKILWHGNGLDADGNAKAPAVATGADGLDGLNDGEVYICDADEDPAMFIKTDAGRVVRLGGGGSGGDTYTREQINQLLAGKVDTAFFSRLFGLMTDAGEEIAVNDVQTAAASILAKLGLYTNSFLSALGLDDSTTGGGGGGGGASTLGQLNNVGSWADEVPTADRVLVQLSGATHWSSKPLSEIVGLDTEALAEYLTENQYATQSWVTGQGYATQSWVTGKGYLTSVSLATISDLHSSWDELLGAAPSAYVTRWPTFAEVTDKPKTLAGYGITDAYTKQETDTKLSGKLDQSAFDELFEKVQLSDGTFAIHAKLGLYTDGFLSALGLDTETSGGGGGGTSYDRLDAWADYSAEKAGWVLSAALGEDLNTRVAALEGGAGKVSLAGITDLHSSWDALLKAQKPTTLAGYGIEDAVTLSTAQTITGNKTFGHSTVLTLTGSESSPIRNKFNSNGAITTNGFGSNMTSIRHALSFQWYDSDWQIGNVRSDSESSRGFGITKDNNNLVFLVNETTGYLNGFTILSNGNYSSFIDSRYVLKTGDTMTGVLRIAAGSTSNTMGIANNDGSKTILGYIGDDSYVAMQAGTTRIRSGATNLLHRRNGTDYTIWDSYNDGSGSGLDADTVDGVHNGNLAAAVLNSQGRSGMITGKPTKTGLQMFDVYGGGDDYPVDYGNLLRLRGGVSSGCGELLLGWSGTNNGIEHIYYRNNRDMVETWSEWRTVAFTTDNVASATKLQTARTIWGQRFDGTGNVSGTMTGVGKITASIGGIAQSWSDNWSNGNYSFPWYGLALGMGTGMYNVCLSGYYGIIMHTGNGWLVINNSGNVGIGTESPAHKLHVSGDAYASGYFKTDGWFQNNANGCGLYNMSQNARWYASRGCWNTDKPIIPNSDNTYTLGTLSNRWNYGYFVNVRTSGLTVIGASTFQGLLTANDITMSGNLTASGTIRSTTGVYSDGYVSALGNNTSSDMRLKTKLSDIALTPKDIANAPAMLFAWKKNGMKDVGSSAQYWKNVLPDAVKERDGWLEMAYGNIALVSAISIAKKVVSHEERIAQLEKENIGLKNKIKELERRIA